MSLKARLILISTLIILLFCLNLVALEFYLYWTYEWLDNVMHILGGFLAGNIALIAGYYFSKKNTLSISIIGGLFIGIVWEMAEYYFGISQWSDNFVMDTSLDMLMDIVGAFLAYILWLRIPHSSSYKNTHE